MGCRVQLCTIAILMCEAQGLTCRSVIGKRQSMHALLIALSVTNLHADRECQGPFHGNATIGEAELPQSK